MKCIIHELPATALAGLVAIVFLTSCSDRNQAEISTQPTRSESRVQVDSPDAAPLNETAQTPLPGLKLGYGYVVKSDSTYAQKGTGQLRRAWVLEFNDDRDEVFEETSNALKSLGFTTRKEPTVSEEVIRQSFFGRGGAYLEVKNTPSNTNDSRGTVALSWPVQSEDHPVPLFQGTEEVSDSNNPTEREL